MAYVPVFGDPDDLHLVDLSEYEPCAGHEDVIDLSMMVSNHKESSEVQEKQASAFLSTLLAQPDPGIAPLIAFRNLARIRLIADWMYRISRAIEADSEYGWDDEDLDAVNAYFASPIHPPYGATVAEAFVF